jgi:hypothetical protein
MLTRQFMISYMFGTPLSTTETHREKNMFTLGWGVATILTATHKNKKSGVGPSYG